MRLSFSAWSASLAVLATTAMSGCVTRDPSVEIERRADGAYRIAVLRCRGGDDEAARATVRADLDVVAKRRCRRGYRWSIEPEFANAHLGNAVFGECPAIEATATALCENSP